LHRQTDAGYKVYVVVSWEEGSVKVTAQHGNWGTFEEGRGEEFSASLGGVSDNQETALEIARLVQSYLDQQEPDYTDEEKDVVKRAFRYGEYGVSDSAESIQREAIEQMRKQVNG
jgi:hypothetical protein